MANKFYMYSHKQFKTDLLDIVQQMTGTGDWKPELIVGIARGGLVPAAYLSHYYNIPMRSAEFSTRDFANKNVDFEKIFPRDFIKILIVDDMIDSGETLKQFLVAANQSGVLGNREVRTAVLIHNTSNKANLEPDYHAKSIDKNEDDSWIIYPWEKLIAGE